MHQKEAVDRIIANFRRDNQIERNQVDVEMKQVEEVEEVKEDKSMNQDQSE